MQGKKKIIPFVLRSLFRKFGFAELRAKAQAKQVSSPLSFGNEIKNFSFLLCISLTYSQF